MGIKVNLTEAAIKNGRKYIYPIVIGTIEFIATMPGSPVEKLRDINGVLLICDQIRLDESLPWEPTNEKEVCGDESKRL